MAPSTWSTAVAAFTRMANHAPVNTRVFCFFLVSRIKAHDSIKNEKNTVNNRNRYTDEKSLSKHEGIARSPFKTLRSASRDRRFAGAQKASFPNMPEGTYNAFRDASTSSERHSREVRVAPQPSVVFSRRRVIHAPTTLFFYVVYVRSLLPVRPSVARPRRFSITRRRSRRRPSPGTTRARR